MSYLTLSYLAHYILVQWVIVLGLNKLHGLSCAPWTGWSLPYLSFGYGSALFYFLRVP